jgi:putative hydrolase of the HAD superfamily
MPKAMLLDVDGVVLKKGTEYFSVRFAREYGAPAGEVTAFFKNEYRQCQLGKLDLKEELVKRLPVWGWSKSTEEFLEYWFGGDEIDEEVLAVAQELRAEGIPCYLATDQEKYRKEFLTKKLAGKLDGFFISSEIGHSKSEPEFFTTVLEKLALPAAEVEYWDDDQENVDVAKAVGIDAHFYASLQDFKDTL